MFRPWTRPPAAGFLGDQPVGEPANHQVPGWGLGRL